LSRRLICLCGGCEEGKKRGRIRRSSGEGRLGVLTRTPPRPQSKERGSGPFDQKKGSETPPGCRRVLNLRGQRRESWNRLTMERNKNRQGKFSERKGGFEEKTCQNFVPKKRPSPALGEKNIVRKTTLTRGGAKLGGKKERP